MSPLFESLAQSLEAAPLREAAGLAPARRAALAQALAAGVPSQRQERWKYTSLRALERRRFDQVDAPELDGASLSLPTAPRLVFVNGRFAPALSDVSGLPAGVSLRPLSQLLAQDAAPDVAFLERRFEADGDAFAQLNAALATEGAVLRVAAGVQPTAPLHLVFLGAPATGDAAFALRHRIELGQGARLSLVEHHRAAGTQAHFGNALAQIQLDADAELVHLRIQSETEQATQILRSEVELASDSVYRRLDLELGAALTRHELNVALRGARARLHANGVLLADGRRHLDTRLGIEHAARDTSCLLEWRGLGAQRSRAVFHGGILIQPGADGTDARLSSRNLLLSAEAEIDTQPVLEIHADEVQAAHGATVGSLDDTALFYLRSRGIPEAQARQMLTAAFCREVLDVLEPALREIADAALDARLDALA